MSYGIAILKFIGVGDVFRSWLISYVGNLFFNGHPPDWRTPFRSSFVFNFVACFAGVLSIMAIS